MSANSKKIYCKSDFKPSILNVYKLGKEWVGKNQVGKHPVGKHPVGKHLVGKNLVDKNS